MCCSFVYFLGGARGGQRQAEKEPERGRPPGRSGSGGQRLSLFTSGLYSVLHSVKETNGGGAEGQVLHQHLHACPVKSPICFCSFTSLLQEHGRNGRAPHEQKRSSRRGTERKDSVPERRAGAPETERRTEAPETKRRAKKRRDRNQIANGSTRNRTAGEQQRANGNT